MRCGDVKPRESHRGRKRPARRPAVQTRKTGRRPGGCGTGVASPATPGASGKTFREASQEAGEGALYTTGGATVRSGKPWRPGERPTRSERASREAAPKPLVRLKALRGTNAEPSRPTPYTEPGPLSHDSHPRSRPPDRQGRESWESGPGSNCSGMPVPFSCAGMLVRMNLCIPCAWIGILAAGLQLYLDVTSGALLALLAVSLLTPALDRAFRARALV